jgi:hypothetical protein
MTSRKTAALGDRMTDTASISNAAHELTQRLRRQSGGEEQLVLEFSETVRAAVPLDDAARTALARSLFIARSLTDDWVRDLSEMLEASANYLLDDDVVELLTDRLAVLNWAWGPVPETASPEEAETLRADWNGDLDRVLA